MTTNNHSAIATGAAANAATFNTPLGQLDDAIRKNNYTATSAPTTGDDSGDGYSVGSRWINTTTDRVYVCVDATVGAAIWLELTSFAIAPYGMMTLTGAAQTISTSTNTKIALDANTHANKITVDTTNNRITALEAGRYWCFGQVEYSAGDDGKTIQARLYKNGAPLYTGVNRWAANGLQAAVIGALINLAVSDYVELWTFHDATTSKDATTARTYLVVYKVGN